MDYKFYGHKLPINGWATFDGYRADFGDMFKDGSEEVPFHPMYPLVFHVLTKYPKGEDNLNFLKNLWQKDVDLLPAKSASAREKILKKEETSLKVYSLDKFAGDDQYIFMTPFAPYQYKNEKYDKFPALAFYSGSLESLAASTDQKLSVRSEDLLYMYLKVNADKNIRSLSKPTKELLQKMAKCGTVSPYLKSLLLTYHAKFIFSGSRNFDKNISGQDIFELQSYLNRPIKDYVDSQMHLAVDSAACDYVSEAGYASDFISADITEILVPVPVPVRMAAFYRVNGRWHRAPSDTTQALSGAWGHKQQRLGYMTHPQF